MKVSGGFTFRGREPGPWAPRRMRAWLAHLALLLPLSAALGLPACVSEPAAPCVERRDIVAGDGRGRAYLVSTCVRYAENAEAAYGKGRKLLEQGKLDEALTAFQRAAVLSPKMFEAHTAMGMVLKEQGKFDGAIAAFDRAVELNPTATIYHLRAESHFLAGKGRHRSGDIESAVDGYLAAYEDAVESVKRNPENPESWALISAVDFLLENDAAGCKAAKRACTLGRCAQYEKFKSQCTR